MRGELPPPLLLPRKGPPLELWWALAALFACVAVLTAICGLGRASRWRPGLAAAAGVLAVSLSPTPVVATATRLLVLGRQHFRRSDSIQPVSRAGHPRRARSFLTGQLPAMALLLWASPAAASAATVPASVTVANGATSATFTVNTTAVTASTPSHHHRLLCWRDQNSLTHSRACSNRSNALFAGAESHERDWRVRNPPLEQ